MTGKEGSGSHGVRKRRRCCVASARNGYDVTDISTQPRTAAFCCFTDLLPRCEHTHRDTSYVRPLRRKQPPWLAIAPSLHDLVVVEGPGTARQRKRAIRLPGQGVGMVMGACEKCSTSCFMKGRVERAKCTSAPFPPVFRCGERTSGNSIRPQQMLCAGSGAASAGETDADCRWM